MKQAIVIRTDLDMGRGKIAAQSSHASVSVLSKAKKEDIEEWKNEGMKKVVLKVSSEEELMKVYSEAKKAKLPCVIIEDRGLTQVEAGSATAVGIGPAEDSKIDKITGKLKLL